MIRILIALIVGAGLMYAAFALVMHIPSGWRMSMVALIVLTLVILTVLFALEVQASGI